MLTPTQQRMMNMKGTKNQLLKIVEEISEYFASYELRELADVQLCLRYAIAHFDIDISSYEKMSRFETHQKLPLIQKFIVKYHMDELTEGRKEHLINLVRDVYCNIPAILDNWQYLISEAEEALENKHGKKNT